MHINIPLHKCALHTRIEITCNLAYTVELQYEPSVFSITVTVMESV